VNGRSEKDMTRERSEFSFPRDVLVIEIDRRCNGEECRARNQISLTKAEAIEYRGFNCSVCETWNDDRLTQSEMPDSWNEQSIN
jgi:hypothetical protein